MGAGAGGDPLFVSGSPAPVLTVRALISALPERPGRFQLLEEATMPRLLAAYILIALIAAVAVGIIAWSRYNSRSRTYQRRLRREARSYHEKMGRKDGRRE